MTAVLEDAEKFEVTKWGTLNTAASPNKLAEGHSPNNQNVWMDEKPGSVVTANGYQKLGTLPSNLPVTGLVNFFKTSDGTSRVVCTDGQNVYQTTDYVTYTTIKTGLSQFFQLRGKVIRNKLWLTNGADSVMVWDGAALSTLDGTLGTPTVPKGKFLEYHDERVWLYGIDGDLSSLRFSALADAAGTEIDPTNASAWPVDNEIQISEGDADTGTGIFLYRGYLYGSKQYSIWRIVGDDEYTYTRVKTRASTGTRFQESIQIKDNLVHFIGVDGLYVFDGEEAKRISDIIDPASADEGVFAFRNLQQPLLNNQFWNVSETADFATGTVPANLSDADDQLDLIPADDSQADFTAGSLSNTSASDNPGSLQLALVTSGGTTENLATAGSAALTGGNTQVGSGSSINDDSLSSVCGFKNTEDSVNMTWQVVFSSLHPVGSVTIEKFYFERDGSSLSAHSSKLQYTTDGSTWSDISGGTVSLPAASATSSPIYYAVTGNNIAVSETDITVSFSTISCLGVRLFINGDGAVWTIKELQIFRAGYKPTGTFVSKSIDYGFAPASYGALAADITVNGETYQFGTQSSADGSTWDAIVNVSNGAAIGSTLRRYLRWTVTLNSSNGLNSPVIDKVYVGGTYLSAIHDTGGNIFQWQAFQMSLNRAGETINAYYRAATTSGGVSAAAWTAIVNGAVPATAVANQFIQIRLEFSTTDATHQPFVESFTVNWTLDSGAGINTNQNVASIVILNRYWLAAATLGADANDIVVVLGKSTFGSPFTKKDFAFLSFCRFQDYFIAGSSADGSIYRLETGYSKNGSDMDSLYETQDFSKDGFQIKGRELHVQCDKSGPYNLAVGWSVDGGVSWTEKNVDLTRDDGDGLSFTKKLNINFMGDQVRFRVRINSADQPFSVDGLKLYYRLSPQRGSLNA